MLKTITDLIVKSALNAVATRVMKVVKVDSNEPHVTVDIDVRSAAAPVVTLDETAPVALEPGRYGVIAVFVRLP